MAAGPTINLLNPERPAFQEAGTVNWWVGGLAGLLIWFRQVWLGLVWLGFPGLFGLVDWIVCVCWLIGWLAGLAGFPYLFEGLDPHPRGFSRGPCLLNAWNRSKGHYTQT